MSRSARRNGRTNRERRLLQHAGRTRDRFIARSWKTSLASERRFPEVRYRSLPFHLGRCKRRGDCRIFVARSHDSRRNGEKMLTRRRVVFSPEYARCSTNSNRGVTDSEVSLFSGSFAGRMAIADAECVKYADEEMIAKGGTTRWTPGGENVGSTGEQVEISLSTLGARILSLSHSLSSSFLLLERMCAFVVFAYDIRR